MIVCAIDVEVRSITQALGSGRVERHPTQGDVYQVLELEGQHVRWEVLLCESGSLPEPAASAATRAIEHHQPYVALFVGIAGGLRNVKHGDVVVGEQIHKVDYGRSSSGDYQVNASGYRPGNQVLSQARMTARGEWAQGLDPAPEVAFGPIACGSVVHTTDEGVDYERLRLASPRALAVEMEGHGFADAVSRSHNVQGLVIRGISDVVLPGDKEAADARGGQSRAAQNAARFAAATLADLAPLPQ